MRLKGIAPLFVLIIAIAFVGCEGPEGPQGPAGPAGPQGPSGTSDPLEYVGSGQCAECHSDISSQFADNGHGYKLVKVEGGVAPVYPFSSVPQPPTGYSWNDITYVIGGFGWKARFIDSQGYIITGSSVQYNLETEAWVGYEASTPPGTKIYDCGSCHTTGWDETGQQDNLPGMGGSFAEPGVKCEVCHGPGSRHIETESAVDIIRNTNSSLCGECHTRNSENLIAASGGYIQHHEQYDEMRSAGHVVLECVECHDPHLGLSSPEYSRDAMLTQCKACHSTIQTTNHPYSDCITCHLPEATKSAVASNIYDGDVKAHIFKINTEAVSKDNMFYNNGALAYGAATLDFVCYQCHKDGNGIGGSGSTKTLQELSDMAVGIHGPIN